MGQHRLTCGARVPRLATPASLRLAKVRLDVSEEPAGLPRPAQMRSYCLQTITDQRTQPALRGLIPSFDWRASGFLAAQQGSAMLTMLVSGIPRRLHYCCEQRSRGAGPPHLLLSIESQRSSEFGCVLSESWQ